MDNDTVDALVTMIEKGNMDNELGKKFWEMLINLGKLPENETPTQEQKRVLIEAALDRLKNIGVFY